MTFIERNDNFIRSLGVEAYRVGGSVRDDEVIEAANRQGLAMVLTGRRHFLH